VLVKIKSLIAEFGTASTILYCTDLLLAKYLKVGGLYSYRIVAQPVLSQPWLAGVRGQSIVIRTVGRDESVLKEMPLSDDVLKFRFQQEAICIGAFKDSCMIGCLWICLGPYREDEVRCCFIPMPPDRCSWDFGVYLVPQYRNGLAFARLWDGANTLLRSKHINWSFSRISTLNPRSLASHHRMGARQVGRAFYLRLGKWQLMMASLRPFVHLSIGMDQVPQIRIEAPSLIKSLPSSNG